MTANVIDMLAEFRRIYGHALAESVELEIQFFLKCGFESGELTILYPAQGGPQVVPRKALEQSK